MKKFANSFLFIHKIWFWLCLIPWFILLYNGMKYGNMDALVAYVLGIALWAITLVQEIFYRTKRKSLKTVQIILSFLKCAIFLFVYLIFSHLGMRFEVWRKMTIFLIFCVVAFMQCLLENISINKRYDFLKR